VKLPTALFAGPVAALICRQDTGVLEPAQVMGVAPIPSVVIHQQAEALTADASHVPRPGTA
jgi:hypothetical protein